VNESCRTTQKDDFKGISELTSGSLVGRKAASVGMTTHNSKTSQIYGFEPKKLRGNLK
jgi:hypothetical protein